MGDIVVAFCSGCQGLMVVVRVFYPRREGGNKMAVVSIHWCIEIHEEGSSSLIAGDWLGFYGWRCQKG